MLSDDELSNIRADVESLLMPDTATILTPTTAVDAYGGITETWGTADTVACRIDPFNRQDSKGVLVDQENSKSWYQFTCPSSATLTDGDRVVIGSATYDVIQMHDQHSERFVTRALLSLVSVTTVSNTLLYAENVGGAVLANSRGGNWSADSTYGSGGTTIDLDAQTIDTSSNTLQSNRQYEFAVIAQQHKYGEITYTFPTSSGQTVRIILYTYEPFWSSAGSRVFDVAVDGSVPDEFDNIDPYALAGAKYKVMAVTYDHTCTGSLTVALQNVTDNALICGVEVIEWN